MNIYYEEAFWLMRNGSFSAAEDVGKPEEIVALLFRIYDSSYVKFRLQARFIPSVHS